MKKIVSIILILAMLVSCCACSTPGQGGQGEDSGKDSVIEEKSFVIQKNNLESERVEYSFDENGWAVQEYYQISGLKNEEIQASINKELEDTFMKAISWEEYPKYRGMMLEMKKWEGIEPYSDSSNASIYCNSGNILSVVYNTQRNWEDNGAEYKWLYIADQECLNFDLNTGKHIKITDVFRDDIDGLQYINDFINDKINNTNSDEEDYFYSDGWDSFKLIGEFPGITEDQKFYLSSDCSVLYIVLDDETPWAQLYGYNPSYLAIEISDVTALGSKYIKENIYTNDAKNYMLLLNSYEEGDRVYLDKVDEYPYLDIQGLSYSSEMVYYKGMPEYIIDAERDFITKSQEEIDKFINECAMEHEHDGDFDGWITLTSNVSRYADYTNVSMFLYIAANEISNDSWDMIYDYNNAKYVLFKDGQEEPLTAKDVFVSGYDYQTKLGIDDSYGLMLLGDCLYAIKDAEFLSFMFEDIGCENLTIFN